LFQTGAHVQQAKLPRSSDTHPQREVRTAVVAEAAFSVTSSPTSRQLNDIERCRTLSATNCCWSRTCHVWQRQMSRHVASVSCCVRTIIGK